MITGVPSIYIEEVWPRVEPRIARILSKTKDRRYTTSDIKDALIARDMQLWFLDAEDLVIVTQIIRWPRAKEFNIIFVEGKLAADWQKDFDVFVAIAKEFGCDFISSNGRLGWLKKARELWKKRFCCLVTDLEN